MVSEKQLNILKKSYSIALMIDQRVSEGEKINFFNKPALQLLYLLNFQ